MPVPLIFWRIVSIVADQYITTVLIGYRLNWLSVAEALMLRSHPCVLLRGLQLELQFFCKGAGDKTPVLPLTEWQMPVASAAKKLRPQINNSQPQELAEL